jgi:periplasmic protein TonB
VRENGVQVVSAERALMEKAQDTTPDIDVTHGHLSVRVEGAHPPEVRFAFSQQPRRTSFSVATGALLQAGLLFLFIFVNRLPHLKLRAVEPEAKLDQLVWLAEEGPGGGGGGGGNHMPDPPKAAEVKAKVQAKISVPVAPPAPLEAPKPKQEPDPVQQLQIPAVSTSASLQDLPGIIAAPGPPSASLGSGSGGGAGTGSGGGVGPGNGNGLGPGSGGGTGGGVYEPGNGVSTPQPIFIPKPSYTPEAMRARIQGTARLSCVVQPNGMCTNIEIVRSVDPTFGLDLQAINNVKQWKFKPGLRYGQPVAVHVTIEVEFTVR